MEKMIYAEVLDNAKEVINNDCFDILDDLSEESFADIVAEIYDDLQNNKRFKTYEIGDYKIKVINSPIRSLISVSNVEGTGVSNSCYYIYDDGELLTSEESLKTIADMVNEAWYLLNN